MIPQGIFTASSQCKMRFPFPEAFSVNSKIPAAIAMMVSSMPGNQFSKKKDLVIQQIAVVVKTTNTVFSSRCIGPNSLSKRLISAFPPGKSFCLKEYAMFVRYHQLITSKIKLIGKPNLNH